MAEGILAGIRIVDLSTGIAGPVATMLLAEAGADVVKVEGPTPGTDRDHAGFRTWNRSKRSVVADLTTDEGRARLEQLLASADVLVHQLGPTASAHLGLDDDALAARHPHLIASSVLSWPMNHPDADLPVDDLLAMARLGICDEQMPMNREGPVYIRFPLGSWGAVYLAASGIVARLITRGRTGVAGPAHTSLVQGALVPMGMHWHRAETPSDLLTMGMPKEGRGSQSSLFECGDGVWLHLMAPPDAAPLMKAALAEMSIDVTAPPSRSAMGGYPYAEENRKAFLTRPSHEWLADLWASDIPAQPALPFGSVYDDEQCKVNGYVVELDDPVEGRITTGGRPLTITPPQEIKGPAPAHGAHTGEVMAEWSPKALSAPASPVAAAHYPLEGLKVLDFGNFLAGPYAPMLLADLGADVVKVEASTGDPMRWGDWPFAGCQRGKRSVALDLKSPDAKPVLDQLLRWADVVHHNLRMPAARRLGLDYESVKAVNPEVVFCHTSSYGPTGERADWPGYDQLFQAQCGWEQLGAGEGNPPMWHRFGFMDHQCALSSLVATLLALYRRDQTGMGSAVAGSLLGAGALTNSETFKRADGTLVPFATIDADQTGEGPGRRMVQVADGWVALVTDDPSKVEALVSLAERKVEEVLADLAGAGVAAQQVRLAQRDPFFDSPDNRAAGMVAEYRHIDWGNLEQPGGMWHFGDMDVRLELAPPGLGEHTVDVLTQVGIDRAEIDRLLAAGVLVAR